MSHFIRASKYRHIFVDQPKVENSYTGFELSTSTGEQSYIKGNVKAAALQNKAGEFLKPSVAAGARALNGISLDKDLAGKNPNPTAKGAYPIATLTWVLAYKTGNGKNAKVVQEAFNYMLSSKAQDKAPSLGFVPLKGDILAKSKAAVKKIGQ